MIINKDEKIIINHPSVSHSLLFFYPAIRIRIYIKKSKNSVITLIHIFIYYLNGTYLTKYTSKYILDIDINRHYNLAYPYKKTIIIEK